jgi:HEAT repeat protein
MAVTMDDVRTALDPEEPNYQKAAKLGPEALPHLDVLVSSGDSMLASKATYLASMIKSAESARVVAKAARSADPIVRVAAAAAASKLSDAGASDVLLDLVGDPDPGVRKVARAAAPSKPSAKLAKKLESLQDESPEVPEPRTAASEPPPTGTGLMPGERPRDMTGGSQGMMPGETRSAMPGEQKEMPGR